MSRAIEIAAWICIASIHLTGCSTSSVISPESNEGQEVRPPERENAVEMSGVEATISIALWGDPTLTAELLSLHDSSLLVARTPGLSETTLRADPDNIVVVPFSRIRYVTINRDAHPWPSIAIGAGVGAAIGATIAFIMDLNETDGGNWNTNTSPLFWKHFGTTALGGGLGGLAGGVFGLGWTLNQQIGRIHPANPSERAFLVPVARYHESEPEFLSERY